MPYPEEQGPPVYGDDPGSVPSQTLVRKRFSNTQSPASMQPSPSAQSAPKTSCDLACPKCNQGQIIEGKRGFGCNRYREGCDFVVWKEMASKKLTQTQIQTLIAKGKTIIEPAVNPQTVDAPPTDAENVDALNGTVKALRTAVGGATGRRRGHGGVRRLQQRGPRREGVRGLCCDARVA